MIVLDTHTLIWWVNDPAALSEPSRAAIDAALPLRAVQVSCIRDKRNPARINPFRPLYTFQ
jgi:PIN domain nuclease of toxin-antitoxin system